jgi:hypothetical protein
MVVSDTNPSLYGEVTVRRKVPSVYTVEKGDTLWEICDHYYGDPWAWPQLWAANRNITNPHWIFPGDQIVMLSPSAATGTSKGSETLVTIPELKRSRGPVSIRQLGFVDPNELKASGEIVGSREEWLMLSVGDVTYVRGEGAWKPKAGDTYSIYKVREKLKDSSGKEIGNLVEVLGTARVRQVQKNGIASAVITEAYGVMEREDRVGPLRKTFKRVPARPADKDLDGKIVADLRGWEMVGTDEIVFIDRGKSQGVVVGNRFLVTRQGDGYDLMMPSEAKEDKRFPKENIAEILVLETRDDASVGLVTRELREVRPGDEVRLRKGY